jgi:hypothetical protein
MMMPRPGRVVGAAWLINAIAWFIPVHKYGVRLPKGVPGWEAFRLAVSPIWPYDGSGSWDPWYGAALVVASGLTNLLMVGSLLIFFQRARPRILLIVFAWTTIGAAMVNAQWVFDKDWTDLRLGYYLWWASFMLLSVGALRMARAQQGKSGREASGPTRG